MRCGTLVVSADVKIKSMSSTKPVAEKRKRVWYITDEFGQPLEDGKLFASSPKKAALKTVTKCLPNDSNGEVIMFYLKEGNADIVEGKRTKNRITKIKLYLFQGWKSQLSPSEQSDFTKMANIHSTPHAERIQVEYLTITDVPLNQPQPALCDIEV